jgi:WD domain, G-beta repeat
MHSSRLTSARFVGARAIGTAVQECALDGAEIARATTYRTQILRCTPGARARSRAVDRPTARRRLAAASGVSLVCPLIGHTGGVWAVAWSPDGTRLLTAGNDNTVWVWNATSGLPVGFTIVTLAGGELAVFDTIADQLVSANAGGLALART